MCGVRVFCVLGCAFVAFEYACECVVCGQVCVSACVCRHVHVYLSVCVCFVVCCFCVSAYLCGSA